MRAGGPSAGQASREPGGDLLMQEMPLTSLGLPQRGADRGVAEAGVLWGREMRMGLISHTEEKHV